MPAVTVAAGDDVPLSVKYASFAPPRRVSAMRDVTCSSPRTPPPIALPHSTRPGPRPGEGRRGGSTARPPGGCGRGGGGRGTFGAGPRRGGPAPERGRSATPAAAAASTTARTIIASPLPPPPPPPPPPIFPTL